MKYLASIFYIILFFSGTLVRAAEIELPTDISVGLIANPRENLATGEPITFTLTAKNLGPAPAPVFILISSDIQNEFSPILSGDCPELFAVVSDGETSSHYNYWWYPSRLIDIPVGATVSCHFTLALTSKAASITNFSMGIPDFISDTNAENNLASVILQRAPVSVPTADALALSIIILGLALIGIINFKAQFFSKENACRQMTSHE